MNEILEFTKAALPWILMATALAIFLTEKAKQNKAQKASKTEKQINNNDDYAIEGMLIGMIIGMSTSRALYNDTNTGLSLGISLGLLFGSLIHKK